MTTTKRPQAQKSDKNDRPVKRSKIAPRSDVYLKARQALPIWKHQKHIQQALKSKDILVIVGETGSGKSTQVPQFLYQEPWCQRKAVKIKGSRDEVNVGGMIAITQPRRVAATTLAHRVSQEIGTPLGKSSKGLVGYSVRFDHNVPKGAKIKYLTEGMLLQELLRDRNLRQYSAIIVDEIHERSVDVDLLSGFLKQILEGDMSGRGGIALKIVIMSATANVEGIRSFFSTEQQHGKGSSNIEFLQVEGRQHPVAIVHSPKPIPRADAQQELIKRIFRINHSEPLPGDILAFLIGQEEIESTQRLIEEYAESLPKDVPKVQAVPLYGQLSIEAQTQAFQPIKVPMTRKVVLATNIAETSVTVPGVRYVVDCGEAKVKQYRPALNIESLNPERISQSSAIQRAGRAGREGPGKCYRLYTQQEYDEARKEELPEILRVDVVGAILTMKACGIRDVYMFPLMDRPDVGSIEKGLVQLHFMGALDEDTEEITEVGRKMASFPVTAPFGRVLLAAAEPSSNCLLEAIDIIACITAGETIYYQLRSEEETEEVEELRKQLNRREGDLLTYLMTMQAYTAENSNRVEWCIARRINLRTMRQALKIRKQLRYLCRDQEMITEIPSDPQPFIPLSPERAEVLLKCFLKGFALKSAFLAPDKSYVTSQGRHIVAIHPSSVLRGAKREAIMYLDHVFTTKSYAKRVSAIQAQWVLDAFH